MANNKLNIRPGRFSNTDETNARGNAGVFIAFA